MKFYRYGIRIDPIQWFVVLNGGTSDFNTENPSVFLFLCKNNCIVSCGIPANLLICIIIFQISMFTYYLLFGLKSY